MNLVAEVDCRGCGLGCGRLWIDADYFVLLLNGLYAYVEVWLIWLFWLWFCRLWVLRF